MESVEPRGRDERRALNRAAARALAARLPTAAPRPAATEYADAATVSVDEPAAACAMPTPCVPAAGGGREARAAAAFEPASTRVEVEPGVDTEAASFDEFEALTNPVVKEDDQPAKREETQPVLREARYWVTNNIVGKHKRSASINLIIVAGIMFCLAGALGLQSIRSPGTARMADLAVVAVKPAAPTMDELLDRKPVFIIAREPPLVRWRASLYCVDPLTMKLVRVYAYDKLHAAEKLKVEFPNCTLTTITQLEEPD